MVMKRSDITYVASAVFTACTGLLYVYARWASITVPRYYPLEHTWKMVKEKGVPSQAWYSVQCFAFIGGLIAAVVVYFVLKSFADKIGDLSNGITKCIGIVVTLIMVFSLSYIVWHEFTHWGIF